MILEKKMFTPKIIFEIKISGAWGATSNLTQKIKLT